MQKISDGAIFKGAASLTLAMLIVKVFGVLYKIPLSYLISEEGMGYFNSAYTIYGLFFVLCSTGMPKAITMLVANKDNAREVIDRSLRLFFKIGLIIFLLLFLFSPILSNIIGSKKSVYSLIAISPSILFVCISGVYRGYFNGVLKLLPIAISQILEAVLKLILGLILGYLSYRSGHPTYIVSAFAILGITVGSATSMLYLKIAYKSLIKGVKAGQSSNLDNCIKIRNILKIALPISLSSVIVNLGNLFDLSIILRGLKYAGYEETKAVALYGNYSTLALPMFNLVTSLISPLFVALLPKLCAELKSKNSLNTKRLSAQYINVLYFLVIPVTLVLNLYSFSILDLLYSSSSSAVGAEALSILAYSLPVYLLLCYVNTYLESKRELKVTLISLLAGTLVKLVLCGILIKGSGISAVSIATLFGFLVSLCISLLFVDFKELSLGISRLFVCALSSVVGILIPYFTLYRNFTLGGTAVEFILLMLLSASLYLISTLLICLILNRISLNGKVKLTKLPKKYF